jgi:hypothetical protein
MMGVSNAVRELTDPQPVEAESLRLHLVRDHGRAPHEIAGLPLGHVHELEHFDQTMGLLTLHHSHTT